MRVEALEKKREGREGEWPRTPFASRLALLTHMPLPWPCRRVSTPAVVSSEEARKLDLFNVSAWRKDNSRVKMRQSADALLRSTTKKKSIAAVSPSSFALLFLSTPTSFLTSPSTGRLLLRPGRRRLLLDLLVLFLFLKDFSACLGVLGAKSNLKLIKLYKFRNSIFKDFYTFFSYF